MNLESEVICGYEVHAKMKRLWAMELDLVKAFVAVCERHGLAYRMMGGTLLGAVRHQGFIPWDNDIDLAMPRKDFDKLLEIGPKSFEKPFFFQTPVTEQSRFFSTYVKIRNENGTAGTQEDFDQGLNCGVFIDVFCLDEIPDGKLKRKWYFRQLNEVAKMSRFSLHKTMKGGLVNTVKHGMQKIVFKYIYGSPDASRLFEIYQKKAGRYAGQNKSEVAHQAFGYHDNFVWKRKDWADATMLSFQDVILCAPVGYDAILRHQFGDYMRIPDDKATHDYIVFDPDVTYQICFGGECQNMN